MAKVKATISFAGKISAMASEIIEVSDKNILADLLRAGYVEEIETEKKPAKKKGDK